MNSNDVSAYAKTKYPNGKKPCDGPSCKGEEQPFSEFGRTKNTKIGLNSQCKKCLSHKAKEYQARLKNRTKDEILKEQKKLHPDDKKHCYMCKETLPLSEFGVKITNASGLNSGCTSCRHKDDEKMIKFYSNRTDAEIKSCRDSAFPSGKRKCHQCDTEKTFDQFYVIKSYRYGIDRTCIECVLKKGKDLTKWKLEQKMGKSCARCGYNKDPQCLDLAHLDRSTKYKSVYGNKRQPSEMSTKEAFLKEMKISKLLCRCCHAIETKEENDVIFANSKNRQTPGFATKYSISNAEKLKRGECCLCHVQVKPDNFVAFHFDHVPVRGKKIANVTTMVAKNFSPEIIKVEMQKCQLLCANCHMIVTVERAKHTAVTTTSSLITE